MYFHNHVFCYFVDLPMRKYNRVADLIKDLNGIICTHSFDQIL
jgi:hypothetical protein